MNIIAAWFATDLFAPRGRGGMYPSVADLIDASGDCWEWQGAFSRHGYGTVSVNGRRGQAHNVVWEALVGPIPEGMNLDHLCRNTACVNPDHLESVLPGVNAMRGYGPAARNARKTHCKNGHPFTEGNMVAFSAGELRRCKTCHRDREKRYRRSKV